MFETNPANHIPRRSWWLPTAAVAGLLIVAPSMAWVASDFQQFSGWLAYLAVLIAGAAILWLGWRSLAAEPRPAWLGGLLILAALLRLGLGIFWSAALPVWGYQSPVEQAGYVMQDAYKRDTAAWKLAESGESLWNAFTAYRSSDQYGGLLFVSALVYRALGGEIHRPLLMVVIGAAFSALAVIFTWAFGRRLLGERTAAVAAWGIALYPEAVLLGSTQMREAYTIPLAAIAIYGLLRYRQDHHTGWLVGLLGALLVSLLLSPPSAVIILVVLILLALALEEFRILRRKTLWLVLGLLVFLALIGLWLAWSQIAPPGVSSPLGMLTWWLHKAADLQAFQARQASGWVQRIFRSTPDQLHLPLLVLFGGVQPFLPAALGAGGAPIWQAIAIWRALGWTILLILLVYALWMWLRSSRRSTVLGAMQLVVWAVILIASLRSGGDQWDNPRYRATLASVQVVVAAWGLIEGRRTSDPWLRRVLVGTGLVFAWFVPWYLRRYTGFSWPVVDPFKTLGLGLASAALYFLWDWARLQPDHRPSIATESHAE
jgi:hypothetical protein